MSSSITRATLRAICKHMRSIWIGYDPREADAFAVARGSIRRHASTPQLVMALELSKLREAGLYTRPTSRREGRLWDDISDAPMATQFAVSRFLVPHLAGNTGWALFIDCDFLALADISELFSLADDRYAVMCVKHDHRPSETVKMDGQLQTFYARKNWSSCCLWNLSHPANGRLTVDMVNTLPGRELHAFCWLKDDEIGALPPEWNYLVGYTKLPEGVKPKLVHHTDGIPSMRGFENAEYADEWRAELNEAVERSGGAREEARLEAWS